jgi:hypothetical protein
MYNLNTNRIKKKKLFSLLLFFTLVIAGTYLCYFNNYGYDWDTYSMINTFYNILENKTYLRSRGYGYLVPEIGIGFLSFYFGSFITNLFCFFLLICGMFFFYNFLNKEKKKNNKILLFFILCLSNIWIIGEATIPMDYSWSFFFLSLGAFLYSKNKIELSILFFSLTMGSRLNFIIYIIPIIFLSEKNLEKKLIILFCVIFFGLLFFVPTWLLNGFSLDFIYSKSWFDHYRPDPIFSIISISKFIYKIFISINFYAFFFFIFLLYKYKFELIKNFKLVNLFIILNLCLFFIFPWIPAHLWIFIFSFYYILVQILSYKMLLFLIFLNISTWIIQFQPIKILYTHHDCFDEFVGYQVRPHFSSGFIKEIEKRKIWSKCYPLSWPEFQNLNKFSFELENGKKLYK